MSPLGFILVIMAAALITGLLILASLTAARRIRLWDAERARDIAPWLLLREQDDVICTVIDQLEELASPELRDRMIAAHEHYTQVRKGIE